MPIFVGSHENLTNNTVVPGIYLDNSSPVGGAAPGFGIGIEFIASDTGGDYAMGNLNFKWTNVTHNSNVSAFDLQLDNGSTTPATVFSVAGNGDASFVGTLSAASAKLVGVTVANLPASPATGQIAYVTDGPASLAWGETVTGRWLDEVPRLVQWCELDGGWEVKRQRERHSISLQEPSTVGQRVRALEAELPGIREDVEGLREGSLQDGGAGIFNNDSHNSERIQNI